MYSRIKTFARNLDYILSRSFLSIFPERSSLIVFLFHKLFRSEEEIGLRHTEPMQRVTVAAFERFIEYFTGQGYRFIRPGDILTGLAPEKKYALITFDDGYFSSSFAVPVLRKYNVPAVFFITTANVTAGRSFWWDVLYRERMKRGASEREWFEERERMIALPNAQRERYITGLFGEAAFTPWSDIDRPLAPAELKRLAQEETVFLGNHTVDHTNLEEHTDEEIRASLEGAQEELQRLTGVCPRTLSYPNGIYSERIVRVAREAGFLLGVTVERRKNDLPLRDPLRIGRFILRGDRDLERQCIMIRSDVAIFDRDR